MKETIRNYLMQHGPQESNVTFGDDESLLEAGVIDSVSMIELIEFLEKEFDVTIDEDDMTPENFDSVNSIAHCVEQKQSQ